MSNLNTEATQSSLAHDTVKQSGLIFFLLVLMGVMSQFASDNFLPSLPYIALDLHTSSSIAKLSIGLYFLGVCASTLIYGPLSDSYGRRRVLLFGFGIFIAGCFLVATTHSITQLLLGRVVQAAGIGASSALFRVIMRDVYAGKQLAKVGSYLGMAFAIVPPLAPITGGYIQEHIGWRANFILLLILSLILTVFIAVMLPETLKVIHRRSRSIKEVILVYFGLLSHRQFLGYVACSGLAFANIMVYVTASPFLFQHTLKLSPVKFGWLAPFITLSYLLGAMFNVKLLNYYSSRQLLRLAGIVMITGGIAMLAFGLAGVLNVSVIIIPLMLISGANGFVFSNAFACAFEPMPEAAGIAGALYSSLQTMTAGVASALAALIPTHNQIILASTLTGMSLLFVFTVNFILKINRHA
ncbi:MAG: multidrug effflux MFS transporter [Legionellales bacterium]|nr:multidrug effflux MFS transporter [Legionellales bacterium]